MKFSTVLWGLLFIVAGVLLGLNVLGITNFNLFFEGWWTLFIIIPSFIGLFDKDKNDRVASFIFLLIGIALLLACNDIITFEIVWKLLLPVILILIGLSIIFKNNKPKFDKVTKTLNQGNYICSTFREEIIKHDGDFDGITLEAIFGSIRYDLSEAKIEKDALIKASTTFGSIKIIVPKGIKVVLKSNGIFAENRSGVESSSDTIIYVDANSVFGGVKVYDK